MRRDIEPEAYERIERKGGGGAIRAAVSEGYCGGMPRRRGPAHRALRRLDLEKPRAPHPAPPREPRARLSPPPAHRKREVSIYIRAI